MYKSVTSTEAKQDIAAAVLYYKRISQDLKEKFVRALEKSLEDIRHFPQAYGYRYENVRAANLKKFKYLIYFIVDEPAQTVKIFAVLHGGQDQGNWKKRLD